ncbi:protein ROOT INITIATION DEFECTIVE 3 [Pelomyxa schiedti]|nr:protein ROOT INITIATION DEFECTIVE 3 [Pelomyxa schiedti]
MLVKIGSGRLVRFWEGHFKRVSSLAITKDDGFLVSAGEDAFIHVWDIASVMNEAHVSRPSDIKPFRTWSEHSLPVTQVVCGFAGVSSRVVSVSLDHTMKIWDIPSGVLVYSVLFPSGLTCVALDPLDRYAVVGSRDSNLYRIDLIEDLATNQQQQQQQTSLQNKNKLSGGHTLPVTCVCITNNGQTIVSGGLDGTVVCWDPFSCNPSATLTRVKGGQIAAVSVCKYPTALKLGQNRTKKSAIILQPFSKFPKHRKAEEIPEAVAVPIHPLMVNAMRQELNDIWDDETTGQEVIPHTDSELVQHMTNFLVDEHPFTGFQSSLKDKVKEYKEREKRWQSVIQQLYSNQVDTAFRAGGSKPPQFPKKEHTEDQALDTPTLPLPLASTTNSSSGGTDQILIPFQLSETATTRQKRNLKSKFKSNSRSRNTTTTTMTPEEEEQLRRERVKQDKLRLMAKVRGRKASKAKRVLRAVALEANAQKAAKRQRPKGSSPSPSPTPSKKKRLSFSKSKATD